MSESNIELTRRGFEAFNRGDIAGLTDLFAKDVTIHSSPELPNSGDFEGHDGFLEWAQAWLEAWETFQIEMRDVTVIGDAVVASVHQVGSGRGSGLQVEMDLAYLFRFRDGKVIGFELHPDRERALKAARAAND